MGEPSRRRLIDLLLLRGEATSTGLAAEVPFSRQAVDKHLAVLDSSGLVERRRDGRQVFYRVRPERLDQAARAMADAAAAWDLRLQAIKAVAESIHSQAANEAEDRTE